MPQIDFKPTLSRNLLFGMILTSLVCVALLYWFRAPLIQIYFHQRLTPTGLILNGMILLLFFAGMVRVFTLLLRYRKEERAIDAFIAYIESDRRVSPNIAPHSIIAKRYVSMAHSFKQGITPNHAAYSQILVANESIRGSMPRFINNILILTGVFGTIVSLSIALFGTSHLIDNASGDTDGINLVIHGMSSALSTTMTAIACYVVFGYFYLRLNTTRTQVISYIEQITNEYLIPEFRVKSENIAEEVASLVGSLQQVVENMLLAQSEQKGNENMMRTAIIEHDNRMNELNSQLSGLRKVMLRGFRLVER